MPSSGEITVLVSKEIQKHDNQQGRILRQQKYRSVFPFHDGATIRGCMFHSSCGLTTLCEQRQSPFFWSRLLVRALRPPLHPMRM